MRRQLVQRKPSFHRQTILILLPLVVLVTMGAWSLRQDRKLATQEARGRAQPLAESLLTAVTETLASLYTNALTNAQTSQPALSRSPAGAVVFQVSPFGQLQFPARVANPSPRLLDPALLDPEAARLWETARAAEFRDHAAEIAQRAYRQFLEELPPEDFAATARLSLAILEGRNNRRRESFELLQRVIQEHPAAILESGLPASTIAALNFVAVTGSDPGPDGMDVSGLLDSACSNAVENPSWVTPPLLESVAALAERTGLPQRRDWRSIWIQHEQARRLSEAARPQLAFAPLVTITGIMTDPQFATATRAMGERVDPPAAGPFWISFSSQEVAWLAIPEPAAADRWIVCLPENAVSRHLESLCRAQGNLPAYLGVGVTVGARQHRFRRPAEPDVGDSQPAVPATVLVPEASRFSWIAQPPGRPPDGPEGSRFATGSAVHPVLGHLIVDFYLDHPAQLFARQRTRTYWFAALIAISASAALVGLVSGWRAFHRQELLARMQSQFVSSVSHELRAPIASIRLLAEGLELGRVRAADKQAEYFNLMGQECRRLTALIENVLDFSRIDQGRKQFEFEPTDIRALVRQTVRLMEPQATERQVALTMCLRVEDHGTLDHGSTGPQDHETTASQPQPSLDGRAIQQALVNLIDNAIKHAPPHSTVDVGLAFDPPDQAPSKDPSPDPTDPATPFRIWVRDSGEGIPATEHEKIFEPFYRRGTELRRETTGIGIGLSIVRHIVAAHGGRVTVESEPGHSTRFTLHFP